MAEDGAMEFVFGESTEVVFNLFWSDVGGFIESFAFGDFGHGGGAGDGGGAAVGFPFDVFDPAIADLDVYVHFVTTDGVAGYADGVEDVVGGVADEEVFGMKKVFLDGFAVDPGLGLVSHSVV